MATGIDAGGGGGACIGMAIAQRNVVRGQSAVVGSIGDSSALASVSAEAAMAACDWVELRLDLLCEGDDGPSWDHLRGVPLLMTARRADEGGCRGLAESRRLELLEMAISDAALLDLEVAVVDAAGGLIQSFASAGKPWIASFHDFEETPDLVELRERAAVARGAGATAFKAAVMIRCPGDLARLADFQQEDHGIAVATMGMGDLAVVSRLLCAQCGSVLNYGHLGGRPTAPGQWSAAEMKSAIARLPRHGRSDR